MSSGGGADEGRPGTCLAGMVRRILFLAGCVPALLAPATPGILHGLTGGFPGKWAVTMGLAVLLAEKVWVMFLRKSDRLSSRAQGDPTAVTTLWANVLALYVCMIDLYVCRGNVSWMAVGLCMTVYAAAVGLRYWALHTLGEQWTVDVGGSPRNRRLVTTGPYGLMRHPLYFEACVELVALCAAMGSPGGVLTALAAFVPAVRRRAGVEEEGLRRVFGKAYDDYAAITPAFLPFGSWKLLGKKACEAMRLRG